MPNKEKMPTKKIGGLVAAYLLDGKGGGRLLDWQALREWRPDDGFLWVHLDRRAKESRRPSEFR